jgi:hypothetical protein
MNRAFDHNGTTVSASRPVKQLRTVKKTLLIDSADRDTVKYRTNGDVIYYLPRVYENVLSIRLKSATFPRVVSETTSPGAITHSYSTSSNGADFVNTGDTAITAASHSNYFILDVEGLNKSDETVAAAQRSSFPDNFFARIPINLYQNASTGYFINYNDNTEEENKAIYSPAIGKLDRIHVVTRLHSQQNKSGFIYWTSSGAVANGTLENNPPAQYSLVFELEMLENGFDDFSSFETRIQNRKTGNYGC